MNTYYTKKYYPPYTKKLYILGYNKMYNEIFKLIDSINRVTPTWSIGGFITYNGLVINSLMEEAKLGNDVYIANNLARGFYLYKEVVNKLLLSGCKFCNLIHPSVDMKNISIGTGCIIQNGTIIGSNTRIGDYVTIRLNSTLSNNIKISNNVFIGPSASIGNNVILKNNSFIGIGSIIYDNVTIGANSTVGAGAVVKEDVLPNETVIGVYSKPMKK